ncbi:MAG: AAA family ATPase, partial [Actinomycetota bacterium]
MVDEVTTSGAGTFAFLFTDIEGSTALAEKLEDYPTRLDRLKRFVSETVAPHSGAVLDMTGDATLSAFKRAGDALRAAVDIQVGGASLTDEQGQLRIGIHVGKAASYKSVWSGVGINHTNRICTAGHGGQILLSAAARVLVEEHLPEGIGLLDIGQHHLKDLAGPQRLFQVTHPALRSNFPRLRTLEFLPNNLPKMLTSFVGRENELSDIKRRMKEARLLTVLGPGGVGKSRLALQVGAEMLNDFDSGVWVVLLAPLTESHLVPQAIAEALAVAEGAGRGLTEAIVEHIGKSSLLLILDNCEHLTSAVAGAVHDLLQQCPNLKVLATSRHVLALQGEALHRIEPLPLPAEDASPDAALHAPAMELLLDRARLVAPNLDLESGSVTYLQDICRRLEGIPLAIELAVPLLKTLSPSDLLSRLNDRLAVLKGGTSSERRHETLFATIDWGHDLLSESERLLFRRISVFPGSFSLETAEEVCASGDLPAQQVFDLVNLLVDKSLVSVEEGPRFRFYLLDTIAD